MDEMQKIAIEQHADWQLAKRLEAQIAQVRARMSGRRNRLEELTDSNVCMLAMKTEQEAKSLLEDVLCTTSNTAR